MLKIIVFTHGDLAKSLKETAELISGVNDHIEFYGVPLGCDTGAILSQVSDSIRKAENSGHKVLVFTDLFFGTPFNLLLSIAENQEVGHITGVNLPMLLEAIALQDQEEQSFEDLISDLVSKGKESVVNCQRIVQNLVDTHKGE